MNGVNSGNIDDDDPLRGNIKFEVITAGKRKIRLKNQNMFSLLEWYGISKLKNHVGFFSKKY